jgi:hypothetical protein
MFAGTMNDNQRKAELSFSYLSAMCAVAGYTCLRGPVPDDDSIDATVRTRGSKRPIFDVQLKATSSPIRHADGLHFNLNRKNYDDLREDRTVNIILVVLELPGSPDEWLECDSEQLVMRRCAWWEWLSGLPKIDTKSKVIVIPESRNPRGLT